MRDALDRVLRERTLVAFALAIALAWSLIQVAEGVAVLVSGLLYEIGGEVAPFAGFGIGSLAEWGGVLVWDVNGRILSFGALLAGLVQFGFVLAVAALVYRRRRDDSLDEAGATEPSL